MFRADGFPALLHLNNSAWMGIMSGIKLIGRAGVSTLCNLVEIHGVDGGKFSTPCFSSYFISSGQLQQEGVSTDDVGGGQKTNEVDVINDCL